MTFEAWLVSLGKPDDVAASQARLIAGVLSSWAAELGLVKQSLHEVSDAGQFQRIVTALQALPVFEARNTVAKGGYRRALRAYLEFLELRSANQLERDLRGLMNAPTLSAEQRTLQTINRIGTGVFRREQIRRWGGCAVTGFPDVRLLVALHIKPWHACEAHEREDSLNGLLLLPNVAVAWQQGFITCGDDGQLFVSSELSDPGSLGIDRVSTIEVASGHATFLAFHRREVFRR